MIRVDMLADTIKAMVEIMVRIPQCVRVTPQISNDTVGRQVTSFNINVHDSDRGKLIGRGGANMRALRVLLNSAAYLYGARYRVTCRKDQEERAAPASLQMMATNSRTTATRSAAANTKSIATGRNE